MDYPKSTPNVGLVGGKFVDENTATGQPGSLIPAAWGNAVTDELLAVIAAAGLAPSEGDHGQLLKAIQITAASDVKRTVRVATTGAIALSGLQTIDGVAVVAGDRVLVKDQAAGAQNWIYTAAAGAWVRALDANESAECTPGHLVIVESGTANAGSIWQLSNTSRPTLGTTALVFAKVFGKSGVAAGSYRQVTVDAQGRVTAGVNPTTLAGYGITDGATKSEVAQKAPLASPTFTGAVAVPTLPGGSNALLAANAAFVQGEISALIMSVLGGDSAFASTMAQALGGKQPVNNTLTALSGLTGAADRLPYFTGQGAMSLATLTAKARSLLACADESAMRLFLGLVKQTSATDVTAGAQMAVGAFNLGATSAIDVESLDARPATEFYRSGINTEGAPPGYGGGYVFRRNGNEEVQDWISTVTAQRAFRNKVGGTFSDWFYMYHTGNLVPAELAPPGQVAFFARSTPPAGWLKANGAQVSRATHAALFAAIGTTYGAGDGSSTFNLPDARGQFLRAWDDGRNIDTGRVLGSYQDDMVKSHAHDVIVNSVDTGGTKIADSNGSGTNSTGTTEATGGNETRPKNIAFLACVKY